MEPKVKVGSIVVVLPSKNYYQGDIVSFKKSKNIITHRIFAKLYPDGIRSKPIYKTGGDANEELDNWEVKNEEIIGKVVLIIPYLGYLANFAKTPWGFILLVISPATIIIYEELKSLIRELISLFKKLYKNSKFVFFKSNNPSSYLQTPGESQTAFENKGISKATVFIPIFGAILVFTGLASSFFFDKDSSIGNIFQASVSFNQNESQPEKPQPGDVVINEIMWMGGFNEDDEWLELKNVSDKPINLKGWNLTRWDNSDSQEKLLVQIPSNQDFIIAPGGFFLIARRNSQAANSNLNVVPDVVHASMVFSNSNLQIKLYAGDWSTATLIDTAGDKGPPFAGVNGIKGDEVDKSMERNSPPLDGTLSSNWHTATQSVNFDDTTDFGTPKAENSPI